MNTHKHAQMHARTHAHTNAHTTHYTVCSGFYLETGFWGKMVKGKCALVRGLGLPPQENVSVPLSKLVYSSALTSRQELSQCHYLKLQLGSIFWGLLYVHTLNPILSAIPVTFLKNSALCSFFSSRRYLRGREDNDYYYLPPNNNCTPQVAGDSRQQQSCACEHVQQY